MCRVIASGNLGGDAEQRYLPNGTAVLNFNLAVNVARGSEKQTIWFSCSLFGKRGEIIQQYLIKGTGVIVDGRFYTEQGKDGRTFLKLVVDDLQFAGGKGEEKPTEEAASPFEDDDEVVPF